MKCLQMLIVLVQAGCSAARDNPEGRLTPRHDMSIPLSQPSVAAVGATMFTEETYLEGKRAITTAAYERDLFLATSVKVPSGTELSIATVEGKTAYCSIDYVYFSLSEKRSACFFDTQTKGILDKFYIQGTLAGSEHDSAIPYRIDASGHGKSAQRIELTYAGLVNGVALVHVRKWWGSETLTEKDIPCPLAADGSADVTYEKARLHITKADKDHVDYSVVHGFL
jgi:hypothetical protein